MFVARRDYRKGKGIRGLVWLRVGDPRHAIRGSLKAAAVPKC